VTGYSAMRSAVREVGERRGGEHGVTLAEITATLALFASLGLIAAPYLPRLLASYRLHGATQKMYAELQQARLAAVMENSYYRVAVLDGTSRYDVHADENGDDVENDGYETLSSRSLEGDSPGVTLSADGAVAFAPNGTARAPRRIHLTNGAGDTSVVAVGAGGRIRVE
jgi:Tfp pilus assembly protein FimT